MNHFSSKDRALRSKLRVQLAKLIEKKKKLQIACAPKSDIEANEGEIDVIRKELKSIEDSGHTVFISAKKMLEPKKELSQKEKKIAWKRKHLEIRLKSLKRDLEVGGKSSDEVSAINEKILKLSAELKMLNQELNAVKDYNHTRFLGLQRVQGQESDQEEDLKNVEQKMAVIRQKLSAQAGDIPESELQSLEDELHMLKLEKEAIENFTHEEFLQNLDSMKAKRRSDLL
jgi:DNA repair exonuclease SbcCD ATPase subunit